MPVTARRTRSVKDDVPIVVAEPSGAEPASAGPYVAAQRYDVRMGRERGTPAGRSHSTYDEPPSKHV